MIGEGAIFAAQAYGTVGLDFAMYHVALPRMVGVRMAAANGRYSKFRTAAAPRQARPRSERRLCSTTTSRPDVIGIQLHGSLILIRVGSVFHPWLKSISAGHTLRRLLAAMNALRHADAVIGVAGQSEMRQGAGALLDAAHQV